MGIRWQKPEDIAAIGTRIKNTDEPRFARFFKVREYVIKKLKGGYLGEQTPDFSRAAAATNDVLEFMANLESDLAFQLPEAEVYTSKSGAAYAAARGAHHALNRWMEDTRYELQIRQSATNYMVGYSVRCRYLAPKDHDGEIDWPISMELMSQRFGWDTDAPHFNDKEYAYQVHEDYQHDLLERAKEENKSLKPDDPGYWNVALIEQIKDSPPAEGLLEQIKGTQRPTDGKVAWFDIYLAKADATELLTGKEKERAHLYHGVMLTVVSDPGGGGERKPGFREIRKARPYFGPKQGPYTLIGMQAIPDESIPASVLLLTIGQSIEFNSIVAANNKAARSYANLIFVDDKRLAQLIESGKHQTVYYKAKLDEHSVQNIQKGGLTEQELTQEERAERIYYRSVGLTDAERGASEGGITATQDAIVSGAATKRRDGQVNTFHLGIEEDLAGILWLLYNTDTVIVEQGPEAVDEFKEQAPVFFGGTHDPEQVRAYYEKHHPEVEITPEMLRDAPEVSLSDLQLRVRMDSMGRKTKMVRLQETGLELQFMVAFTQWLVTSPFVPTATAKRWAARRTGIAELPELIDDAWLELMRGLMIQMQVPPAESAEPEATLGKAGPRTVDMPGSGGQRAVQAKPQNMQLGAGPSATGIQSGQMAMAGAGA